MGPAEPVPLNNVTITRMRNRLASEINQISDLEPRAKPPVVQELVLARRSLEDARMRLGVARAYMDGQEPITIEHVDETE